MNNPEETFRYAYNYIFIIFLGIPAAWIMADMFLVPMYFYGLKRLDSRKTKVAQC